MLAKLILSKFPLRRDFDGLAFLIGLSLSFSFTGEISIICSPGAKRFLTGEPPLAIFGESVKLAAAVKSLYRYSCGVWLPSMLALLVTTALLVPHAISCSAVYPNVPLMLGL